MSGTIILKGKVFEVGMQRQRGVRSGMRLGSSIASQSIMAMTHTYRNYFIFQTTNIDYKSYFIFNYYWWHCECLESTLNVFTHNSIPYIECSPFLHPQQGQDHSRLEPRRRWWRSHPQNSESISSSQIAGHPHQTFWKQRWWDNEFIAIHMK